MPSPWRAISAATPPARCWRSSRRSSARWSTSTETGTTSSTTSLVGPRLPTHPPERGHHRRLPFHRIQRVPDQMGTQSGGGQTWRGAGLHRKARRILQLNRDDTAQGGVQARPQPAPSVITHERLTRMSDLAPRSRCCISTAIMHGFSETTMGATRFVNVSVLDRPVTARPRAMSAWAQADCRNFNAGNYVIIEIGKSGGVTAKPVALPRDYPDWVALEDVRPERHRMDTGRSGVDRSKRSAAAALTGKPCAADTHSHSIVPGGFVVTS